MTAPPRPPLRILILGGTTEAAALARAAVGRPGLQVISSLAGRTRAVAHLPGEVRRGGFGGPEGLAGFLRQRAIDRVVDATHPFAARISANAVAACQAAGVARVHLLRPPWRQRPGDRWIEVDDVAAAAERLPQLGRRALVTVGHDDLGAFTRLRSVWLLVRTIEPPRQRPPDHIHWLGARGPFQIEDERALIRDHAIDLLVTKASGGRATEAKIEAAREFGLPVLVVRRPPPPPGPTVATVAAALAWLGADDPVRTWRSAAPVPDR